MKVFTARVIAQHLNDNNIQSLTWPFKSPNLNPIEQIWDVLGIVQYYIAPDIHT